MRYSYSRKTVRQLASGDALSVSVYTFPGTRKGAPSAYLHSAVHGAEVQGSLVIAKLFAYLEKNPPLGTIRLVPNANPVGLNAKQGDYTDGRHDSSSGENWNRMYYLPTNEFPWEHFLNKKETVPATWKRFRKELKRRLRAKAQMHLPYSENLTLTLQLLSIDFDHCLDLHCANQSVRYLYTPAYASESASYFGIPFHLVMNNKFSGSMDEVFFSPWWTLQEKIGGEVPVQSFTLELGNHEEIDAQAAENDLAGILNYLKHRGVLAGKAKSMKPVRCQLDDYYLFSSPAGGLVEFVAPLGKRVKKGDVLALLYQFSDKPKVLELRSPVSGIPILRHSSSIVHQGTELMKFLAKPY